MKGGRVQMVSDLLAMVAHNPTVGEVAELLQWAAVASIGYAAHRALKMGSRELDETHCATAAREIAESLMTCDSAAGECPFHSQIDMIMTSLAIMVDAAHAAADVHEEREARAQAVVGEAGRIVGGGK